MHLRENHCFKERGTKIMIGRYGDVLKKLKSEMGHHHQRKFFYLMTTQELNMLHRG